MTLIVWPVVHRVFTEFSAVSLIWALGVVNSWILPILTIVFTFFFRPWLAAYAWHANYSLACQQNLPPMEDIAGNNAVKHYSAGLAIEIQVFLLAALGMANANANASAVS
ncbi:hypothetical protein BDR06DRAFT_993773 [Suillus hirtellus]|nr:hypothetical protein BDR06DRAFT_993773 [Suillus hirtellus]